MGTFAHFRSVLLRPSVTHFAAESKPSNSITGFFLGVAPNLIPTSYTQNGARCLIVNTKQGRLCLIEPPWDRSKVALVAGMAYYLNNLHHFANSYH